MTFNKQTPTGGAANSNSAMVLSWTPVADAGMYGLCVQRTADSTCETGWWPVRSASAQLHGLFPGVYYWQVVALTGSGQVMADGGAWSSFTVAGSVRTRPHSGPSGSDRAAPRPPGSKRGGSSGGK